MAAMGSMSMLALALSLGVKGGAVSKTEDGASHGLDQVCGLLRWTRYLEGARGRERERERERKS